MKSVSRILVLTILITGCLGLLYGESAYDEWKRKQEEAFRNYLSAEDTAFIDYLSAEWSAFQAYKGIIADTVPKIDKAPVSDYRKEKPAVENSTVSVSVPIDIEPETTTESAVEVTSAEFDVIVSYFNTNLGFNPDTSLNIRILGSLDNKSIASFWSALSLAEYQESIDKLLYYKDKLLLNDWGFFNLVNDLSEMLYSRSVEQNLFTWFVLVKSGYNVKVGYSGNEVSLLLASDNIFYETPYFIIGETKYFLVSLDVNRSQLNSLYIYSGEYSEENRPIRLNLTQMPLLGDNVFTKQLSFSYDNKEYSVQLNYNRGLIDYFEYYPHTDSDIYFDVSFSSITYDSILTELVPLIKERTEADAANLLLRFVQTSFEYATDQDQFGREKWLFPEEILYYPYCDCEDRSVFYAKLVKSLLGLEVVGINWPGHIAAGVRFTEDLPGDFFMHNGNKYLICDPTYINADIGMCMPMVKDAGLEIIEIK